MSTARGVRGGVARALCDRRRARPARALSPLGVLQMAILRRRTTRAIVDLIRQKMKENDEDDEDDEG